MTLFTTSITFFLSWWVVFYCTLPLWVEDEQDIKKRRQGTASSAPKQHKIKQKLLLTTLVAIALNIIGYLVYACF